MCVFWGKHVTAHVLESGQYDKDVSFHHVVTRVGILAYCAGLIFILNIYKFNK